MAADVLFPRRITGHNLKHYRRSGFGREASVFFLDAAKVDDIIDFWNLRAIGRATIPVPKQLQADPQWKAIVVAFLKAQRRPWEHDPKVCDFATIIRSRNCTMEEMQDYAQTLNLERDPKDQSDSPFFPCNDGIRGFGTNGREIKTAPFPSIRTALKKIQLK